MFKLLKNAYLKTTKAIFDVTDSHKRSSQWGKLQKHIVTVNPLCEGCGATDHLQVHHKKPFHLHPELELDPSNLVVLCMKPGQECHLYLGHGDSWKAYNPNLEMNLHDLQNDSSKRASIIAEAKKNRLIA